MNIRNIEPSDIEALKELHEKYYKDEYFFDNFLNNLLGSFVIENESGIVCAGGVKTITESVLITNKSSAFHDKLEALNMALQVSDFICRKTNHNQLHAFIKDDVVWRAWLKKVGFKKCSSTPYFLEIS